MEGQPERDPNLELDNKISGVKVDPELRIARAYTNALIAPHDFLVEAVQNGLVDPTDENQRAGLEKLYAEYCAMQPTDDGKPAEQLKVFTYNGYFSDLLGDERRIKDLSAEDASRMIRDNLEDIMSQSDPSKVEKLTELSLGLQTAVDEFDISTGMTLYNEMMEEIDRVIPQGGSARAA